MTRLPDIDPTALAADVEGWVQTHMAMQGLRLGLTDPLPPVRLPQLRHAVEELTRYAQHGPPHCDDADGPTEYLQSVIEALYTTAHPDGYSAAPTALDARVGDPEHEIDVVVVAARARERIERGIETVGARELGALAGLSTQRVRMLASAGEIMMSDGEVTADEARRWLGGRGIAVGRRGIV